MIGNRATSLTRRVPLFLAALLAAVLTSATVVGYVELRRLLIDQNQDRLTATTQLLAQLLATQLSTGASNRADSLALLVMGPEGLTPQAATILSDALQARDQARAIWMEIGEGPCLGVIAAGESETVSDCPDSGAEPGQIAGPMFVTDGEVRYRTSATVDVQGTTARMTFEDAFIDAEGAALIASLVAADAELLLGSATGDV